MDVVKFIALLLFISSTKGVVAQTIVTRTIESFGAKANGSFNNLSAFHKASQFIAVRKGNCKITFSKGTYLIDPRDAEDPTKNLKSTIVFNLDNCKNISFVGQPGTIIKYAAGLRYGSFDPSTRLATSGVNTSRPNASEVGLLFYFNYCKSIKISNLELDGNVDEQAIGGEYGDRGIQLYYNGITASFTSGLQLTNLNVHHFGLDGLYINSDSATDLATKITNCKFEYNGRQALSWLGGKNLIATNCSFSYSGQGGVSSSPCAGIDIEPSRMTDLASKGVFNSCKLLDNKGCSVICDNLYARDVKFTACTLWNSEYYVTFIRSPKFVFTGCKISGLTLRGCKAETWQDATRYVNCDFNDNDLNGKKMRQGFLYSESDARRLYFENCTFTARFNKLVWLSNDGYRDVDEKSKMINCKFYLYFADIPKGDYCSIIRSFTLQNNIFYDMRPKGKGESIVLLFERINSLGGNKRITNSPSQFQYSTGNSTFTDFLPGNSVSQ
ncbi:MAG: hypothetical protein RL660_603 [Bacteroidota bacterium]|jgi:hypothetical protein